MRGLFAGYVALVGDGDRSGGEVGEGELADLLGGFVGGILTRSDATRLCEGMNLTLVEAAVGVEGDFGEGGVAADSCDVELIRCAEIAKAIENDSIFVKLQSTTHMRAMTIDGISTGVDSGVSKLFNIASVFACYFFLMRNVLEIDALASTMEADYHKVALALEGGDERIDFGEVIEVGHTVIETEGCKAYFTSVFFDDGCRSFTGDARVGEAGFIEGALRTLEGFLTEIVDVIVRDTDEVEPGIEKMLGIAFRHFEGEEALRIVARLHLAVAIIHISFEIARCDVGGSENIARVLEEESAVFWWDVVVVFRICGAHHDVAYHSYGYGFVVLGARGVFCLGKVVENFGKRVGVDGINVGGISVVVARAGAFNYSY